MKKIVVLFVLTLAIISCKNDSKKEETSTTDTPAFTTSDNYQTIKGEFIYLADAAVLKGGTFIYGVKIDEKMHELQAKVSPLKRDEFDMVPVTIKAEINPKPEGTEGWDEIVTIKEIIEVSSPTGEEPLKIESGS